MANIPKEHEKYELLPRCRKDGYEVFVYPSERMHRLEQLFENESFIPYGYHSYAEYDAYVDSLLEKYADNCEHVRMLQEWKDAIHACNRKEEWSVLRYLGESFDDGYGLTYGRCYYMTGEDEDFAGWFGIIDDEEFTSYLYPADPDLWEIVLDPTGIAKQAIADFDGDNTICFGGSYDDKQ